MERIVYILGAGFSQPLGIPTVRNFIERARDMYFERPAIYGHFTNVLEDIQKLSRTSVLFKTALYDLEEVLSILQTEQDMEGKDRTTEFITLINSVVNDTLTKLPDVINSTNWYPFVQSAGDLWAPYVCFVANLFRLSIGQQNNRPVVKQIGQDLVGDPYQYDVVSLNYDLILERAADCLNRLLREGGGSAWGQLRRGEAISEIIPETGQHRPVLAKLHGSSDAGNIIAPTANKRILDVQDQWQMAYEVLKKTNHVRVIG